MSLQLLPEGFDDLVGQAIELFWTSRSKGSTTQGGTRGNVISGKNMDGFLGVVMALARHCGLPDAAVHTQGRKDLTLPGYYRPIKNWDVVIIHENRLVAVLEFKSQVGSFGNNFNNRTEEAIGNASDLWVAAQEGAYHPNRHKSRFTDDQPDPRPPFLGYLMLLQDCEASTRSVRVTSPHYHIFPEFLDASYAKRYQLLCERLMAHNLYGAASLILTPKPPSDGGVSWRSLSSATDIGNLFTQLSARILAAVQAG